MSNLVQEPLKDNQGWDEYWNEKKSRAVYDIIAEFYRKFIIRPSLNRFIKKHFAKGAHILHAGCGSGQVDRDIRHYAQITGVDISTSALKIYERENGDYCKSINASIFKMPIESGSVDGLYNLGVMEHFTEEEIGNILSEFKRVVKKGGKMVLFWPPEFGLSVIFFKVLKGILEFIFRREFKFHPDEITRVRSKKHVKGLIEKAGLKQVDYSFGPRDVFTYSIVVAQKE